MGESLISKHFEFSSNEKPSDLSSIETELKKLNNFYCKIIILPTT